MMNFNHGVVYRLFEELAKKHKVLKHTESSPRIAQVTPGQMLDLGGTKVSFGADFGMMVERSEVGYSSADLGHGAKSRLVAFSVVKKAETRKAQSEAQEEAELICDDFIGRIITMIENGELQEKYPEITGIVLERVEGMSIGPVLTKSYGVRYEVTFTGVHDVINDESRWD